MISADTTVMDEETIVQGKKSKAVLYKIERGSYFCIKRIFDIICSLIGILLLIPVTLVTKICYLITGDRKSIFYKQKRIGKNGKEFDFYKLRSMIPNADEVLAKMLEEDTERTKEYKLNKKLENDPRVTKVGKVLRKTSLDELPQFINVLKGDMSVIGNRPYLPREKEDMGEYFDDITKTKPGLTGLWQVSGRNDTTFERRLGLEREYSNNYGIKIDVKIFFKTFVVVLKHRGAK